MNPENSVNITPLSVERVEEIIEMNKKKEFPDTLLQNSLKLADLISSKHNVQISSDDIEKSKKYPKKRQGPKKKSSVKRDYSKKKSEKSNRNQENSKAGENKKTKKQ